MVRQIILVCLLATRLVFVTSARAEHTRFWRQSELSEFEKGTAHGVALRSDGKLVPAPRFVQFSDPNLAYLWALRTDSRGRLYAAGGSDAKVVRFDSAGKASVVFESSELAAQALAIDSRDNLFVGTSPDGKVYKVTPEGQRSVFFEPKTKYIWALAFDPSGTLFVGTGDKGKVFAVSPDGKGKLFYQGDERHARSLAFDAKGNLLIGTDPSGLIIRVDVIHNKGAEGAVAGNSFVLYQTDKKEVIALLPDREGNIYAAAIGEKARPLPLGPTVPLTSQPVGAVPPVQQPAPALPTAAPAIPLQAGFLSPFFFPITGGSDVYRLAPDGSPEVLWRSRDELVYALGFSPARKLLLGTGNRGALIELEGDDVFSTLAKAASAQITSFADGADDTIYLATANPGKVFTLGPGEDKEGTFESEPFDARIFSHWGRISWWGENGATNGQVTFYVRSGNTSHPDNNWSAWSGPYTKASGETVRCPPARFAQWKAEFRGASSADAPDISWVSMAYLPKNVAPVIDDIALQKPGIRVQGFAPPPAAPSLPAPVQLRLPRSRITNLPTLPMISEFPQKPKMELPPQAVEQKDYQSVLWSAHDDNDDELQFSIYYRGEGEKNWKLLKNKIEQHFYSWDTSTMPDGAYYLKIVATDAPSNPPADALSAERESDRFIVDNTPPAVENLRAEAGRDSARISFEARDPSSAIAKAEYSLDAGDWTIVFPVGQLTDAPRENYQFELRRLSPGEHTLAVRVEDEFENSTNSKVIFTVTGDAAQ